MPTQDEYMLATVQHREERVKIELLNYQYQVVDSIQGSVVGQPNFTISSSSDIRRTCTLNIVPTDSSFDIEYGSKIWLDKYIRVYKGIKNIINGEYEWTKMGTYIINTPNQTYNANSNNISINGIDLMAKLNGQRGSQLGDATYIIEEGTVIRDAVIAILQENGFTEYVVEDIYVDINHTISKTTPYEIKQDVGGTPYDLLRQLLEIIPSYQMYFDVDGIFHLEKIPNGENEPIVAEKELFQKVMLSYSRNTDYSKVFNSVQVFGKMHDIVHYGEATYEDGTYNIEISSLSELTENIIGFTTDSECTDEVIYININNFGRKIVKNEKNENITHLDGSKYYVIRYDGEDFILLGGVQPFAEYKEMNEDSPFYINGTMGEVRKVFSGGEYDNIYSDELALERAKYELYNNCRLYDNITITCVPIYWLDVNTLIEVTLPNKQGTDYTDKYIIKDISISDTQTITIMKYYPLYPTI